MMRVFSEKYGLSAAILTVALLLLVQTPASAGEKHAVKKAETIPTAEVSVKPAVYPAGEATAIPADQKAPEDTNVPVIMGKDLKHTIGKDDTLPELARKKPLNDICHK